MSQSAEDLQMEALWYQISVDVIVEVAEVKVQIVHPDLRRRHRSLILALQNGDGAVRVTGMGDELVAEAEQTGRPTGGALAHDGHQATKNQLQLG